MASIKAVNLERVSASPSLQNPAHIFSSPYQVSFNPTDSSTLCVTGGGTVKLWKYNDSALRPIQTLKHEHLINSHTWCENLLVLGCEDGKIFALDNSGEFKLISPEMPIPMQVTSLLGYSKGFVVSYCGFIQIYERLDDEIKELFKKMRDAPLVDPASSISNLAISVNEDIIIFTTDTLQVYTCSLSTSEITKDFKIDPFTQPFHHGVINGLDTCVRIPFVVTCSSDKSVRVWNYIEAKSEVVKYFAEEPYSVSIHPSGLYLLVGFSDKLRLMNILIGDIRCFREFNIRGCRECRFSNGGQYFAAVNANTVQLYSTWSFENLGNLKGHNSKVRAIQWAADDFRIITAGADGAIYDWSLKDMSGYNGQGIKRESESVVKTCAYTSVCVTSDSKTIYACGTDKTIKEIVGGQLIREIPSDQVLSTIVLSSSGEIMVVGTMAGNIRVMKFPFTDLQDIGSFVEHSAHSSPISRMRISHDDQYLFTTCEDGTLFTFNIESNKRERDIAYADEILVTKSDMEEKNALMVELKTQVEELKMENEYQLRLKDISFTEKINEMTAKFVGEINSLKNTATVLRANKGKEEIRHEDETKDEKQRHEKEYIDLETLQNTKLQSEFEKYKDAQSRTVELQRQWGSQIADMKLAKEVSIAELTQHFELRLVEKQSEIDQIQKEIAHQNLEFEETILETEQDADTEVIELKHKYEKRMRDEKESVLRLKGENGNMRKKFNTFQTEIDMQKVEVTRMFNDEKKLHVIIKTLEKDISGLKKEVFWASHCRFKIVMRQYKTKRNAFLI